MIDIDKAISTAVKTGKVSFGSNSTIQSAKTGKAKMIVLAINSPKNPREDIEYYSKLSNIPILIYDGSSIDLAAICAKTFVVSALTIKEPGDSEILRLTEEEAEEAEGGMQ